MSASPTVFCDPGSDLAQVWHAQNPILVAPFTKMLWSPDGSFWV